MPVKIRLQRHGKKGKPFYWIVAADARSKRDGKYLEKIGTYNPNVNPAAIDLDIDEAVNWLQKGAQPTDTAKAILSYKGVMLKNHLAGGVRKGALTAEQAEEKFQAWVDEKAGKITAKVDGLAKAEADAKAKETAEKLNAADAMIFQTESQLKEFGEKLSDDKKQPIEEALEELKKAYETKDIEIIDPALEKINEAWKVASEEMYKAQAEAQQGGEAGPEASEEQADESSDVEDVDFEEVK